MKKLLAVLLVLGLTAGMAFSQEEKKERQTKEGPAKVQRDKDPGRHHGKMVKNAEGPKDKGPMAKDGKGPMAKDGKCPMAKDGKCPIAKDGKCPMAKDGKCPMAKDGKCPMAKDGKCPMAKDGKCPMAKDGKAPREGRGPREFGERNFRGPMQGQAPFMPPFMMKDGNIEIEKVVRFLKAMDTNKDGVINQEERKAFHEKMVQRFKERAEKRDANIKERKPGDRKDAPKTEMKKDAPRPEMKKDAPRPEMKKDAPKPEMKKDAPRPEKKNK